MAALVMVYLPLVAAIAGMLVGAMLFGAGDQVAGGVLFVAAIVLFVVAVATGARLDARHRPSR